MSTTMDNSQSPGISSVTLFQDKSANTCMIFKKSGNEYFKKKKYQIAAEIYTQCLQYAPPYCKKENLKTNIGTIEGVCMCVCDFFLYIYTL